MSHYTVLVIGDDVEGQLAPYDENIQVEPYKDYEDPEWLIRAWKRRNEPPPRQKSLEEFLSGDSVPEPEFNYDAVDDPSMEELLAWLKEEEYGEYGVDETGFYRMSQYNPRSKWDWWTVGGRWLGYFKLTQKALDTVATVAEKGQPGAFDNEARYDADHVLKGDVDTEWMRNDAGEKAGHRWDVFQRVVEGLPPSLSWKQVCAKHTDESGATDYGAAREEYHAQERVVAVRKHDDECRKNENWDEMLAGIFDGPEEYDMTREAMVQDARDNAIATYAYLKDGEWVAPGEMGWWGMSSEGELDKRRFVKLFNEMWDELPDDTVLTLIDAHI